MQAAVESICAGINHKCESVKKSPMPSLIWEAEGYADSSMFGGTLSAVDVVPSKRSLQTL
jgi:hypothetical protein